MRILIAGGGAAAVEAALYARKHAPHSSITIFSAESIRPYRRPLLPELLNKDLPDERLYINNMDFYTQNAIELVLNTQAIKVDPAANELYLSNGRVEKFDRLLLAIGSRAVHLPLAGGADLLKTIHDYQDMIKLKQELPDCRNVLIAGGGVLGLELADQLLKQGIQVTIAERQKMLFSSFMNEASQQFLLKELHQVENLTLLRSCQLQKLQRLDESSIMCYLKSPVIRQLKTHLTISAVGTIANHVQWPENYNISQLATNKYLQVKPFKNIYAAGDCAYINGELSGFYRQARSQGAIAGANLAGAQTEYLPAIPQMRTSFMNIKLYYAGNTTRADLQCRQAVSKHSMQQLYYTPQGKLEGCILINDLTEADNYYRIICEK